MHIFSSPRKEQKEPMSYLIWRKNTKSAFYNFDIMIYIQSACILFLLWRFFLIFVRTCNCGRVNELKEVEIKFTIRGFSVSIATNWKRMNVFIFLQETLYLIASIRVLIWLWWSRRNALRAQFYCFLSKLLISTLPTANELVMSGTGAIRFFFSRKMSAGR